MNLIKKLINQIQKFNNKLKLKILKLNNQNLIQNKKKKNLTNYEMKMKRKSQKKYN